MEPIHYQPEDDPLPHEITAEIAGFEIWGDEIGLTFRISSDGEEIGEVDVEAHSTETAFISGVGNGEEINNGYLRPASLAIAACLHEDHPAFKHIKLFDIDNELII